MAEYIEREAVRNELYDADAITMKGVAMLNKFPSADVVEVVRCKDCKHCHIVNEKYIYAWCEKLDYVFESFQTDTRTHFCSYGERREKDESDTL